MSDVTPAFDADAASTAYRSALSVIAEVEPRIADAIGAELADLVVLSDDLLAVAPERIREVQVRATMVGGVFGHDAEGELAGA